MMLVEAAVVLGAVGLGLFVLFRALAGSTSGQRRALEAGRWRVDHYDVRGVTRVVVQRVSAGGTNILDEHVVAEIRRDDPDFDERYLRAMATARERQALFESEADGQ